MTRAGRKMASSWLVATGALALLSVISGFTLPGLAAPRSTLSMTRQPSSAPAMALTDGEERQFLPEGRLSRGFAIKQAAASVVGAVVAAPAVLTVAPGNAHARKAGVNRPELLPKEQTNVIDLVGMLTKGQAKRLNKQLEELETITGYRLRLLCQKYPETPGLAVKDYWKVDDKTIVMVVDPGEDNSKAGGVNILNFNVGDGLRLNLPPQFWQRLQNRYGNRFYVRDNGADGAIVSTIDSITFCLRSDSGFCVDPPDIKQAANAQAVLQSVGKGGR